MLKHRLISGSILAAVAIGILYVDTFLAPYFPVLLSFIVLLGILGTREMLALMGESSRPRFGVTLVSVLVVLLSNWVQAFVPRIEISPFVVVEYAFTAVVIFLFLVEMYSFRGPGGIVARIAQSTFTVAYLGLLPSYLIQIRFLPSDHTTLLLLLTIFTTKCSDIGAYAAGNLFGKHKFTPLLSPKKTWEGFAGGLLASTLTAVGLSFAGPVFRHGVIEAAAFGVVIGLAGVFGDLAESLLKRDFGTKDAAKSIPGMGGILDVIDSILFAAPVAYLWFKHCS